MKGTIRGVRLTTLALLALLSSASLAGESMPREDVVKYEVDAYFYGDYFSDCALGLIDPRSTRDDAQATADFNMQVVRYGVTYVEYREAHQRIASALGITGGNAGLDENAFNATRKSARTTLLQYLRKLPNGIYATLSDDEALSARYAEYDKELARRKALLSHQIAWYRGLVLDRQSRQSLAEACTAELPVAPRGPSCKDSASESRFFQSLKSKLWPAAKAIKSRNVALSAPVEKIEDAFELIASTRQGRDILGAFLPRYRSGDIRILDMDPLKIFADGLDRRRLGYFEPATRTIYVDPKLKRQLGLYVLTLFHEMVHSVDRTETRYDQKILENDLLIASFIQQHDYRHIRAKLMALPAFQKQTALEVARHFHAERLAFSTAYELQRELMGRFPCYEGFLRVGGEKDGQDLLKYTSDDDIQTTYRLPKTLVEMGSVLSQKD
ncbi:MAG: hypothetical protein HY074_04905 [Deltaproteobacteria bacterium]|nr:hypothetical protein [Deltaproteobacteria bacterium]